MSVLIMISLNVRILECVSKDPFPMMIYSSVAKTDSTDQNLVVSPFGILDVLVSVL